MQVDSGDVWLACRRMSFEELVKIAKRSSSGLTEEAARAELRSRRVSNVETWSK